MLLDQFTAHPDQLALDDLTNTRTWRELYQNSLRFSSLIKQQGIKPGDHIIVLMRNRVEFIEIVIAAFFSGVWLTPVNWHLTVKEIQYIIDDTASKLILSEAFFTDMLDVCCVPVIEIESIDLQAFAVDVISLEQSAGAIMMYTSGTTGNPKGVKRAKPDDLGSMLSQQALAGKAIGLDGAGPHLVTGPLYHAAPMLYAIYDLANGAPMIIMPSFDAATAMEIIQQRHVVHSHWVPTMFVRALAVRDCFPDGFPSLQLVLHGAAPVSIALKQEMIDWWGHVLVEYWGATESGIVCRVNTEQWLQNRGTVGLPLPQFEVYAFDSDGQKLEAGKEGLLCIRHKHLKQPFIYYCDERKTSSAYKQDGFFSIGDIGMVNQQGYVYLLDRQSNVIISGGVNIYPAEIEAVFQSHSAIADIAVFGIPNEEWGEEVKAVVVLNENYQGSSELEQSLLDFAGQSIASYKIPRTMDFVNELPRYETGKLHIRELKSSYWHGSGRKI